MRRSKRQYFDPSQEIRCWLEDPLDAGYSATQGWSEAVVTKRVDEYAKELRQRAELAERWLFVMRYGRAADRRTPEYTHGNAEGATD